MDNTTRFAALNTKTKALMGKLLKDDDYISLLSKKSVNEVAAYLKQKTHYKYVLSEIDENDVHRGTIETLIKKRHIDGLGSISNYFTDNYCEFYKTLFIRYEIEDLKIIARGIKTGRDLTNLRSSFTYIGRYSVLDTNELLSSKDLLDFIKNLKGTIYYKYLLPFLESKDGINFFILEMTFDLLYFDIFYKNLKLINKNDRSIIEHYQGMNIDLLNIQWIYRGLKFYSLSPEELFNYTIAFGREFNRNDIKKLCYSKSLDEFQETILGTKYSFLFDVENTKDIFMERRILRYQYFTLKRLKIRENMDISLTLVYELLSETEIRDIISIVENIRYEMPLDEAKKFLIRKL